MRKKRKALKFEFIKKSGELVTKKRKVVVITFLLFVLVVSAVFWLYNFLHTALYFDCYAIEIIKLSAEEGLQAPKDFFKLSRKINIFTADPLVLSNRIKEAHPEFQTVLITKYLPNRLIATIIDRRAVAKIKVGRVYQVDYEGVVLPQVSDVDHERLPFIIGLESQPFNPGMGKKVKSKRLLKALDILALLTKTKELKNLAVEIIDVSYPKKATFKIDGINVILGEGEFEKRLRLLSRILNDPKIDKPNIDYVDLRFTDVVVGTKKAKK